MKYRTMKGYEEAGLIDEQINKLLMKVDITKGNALEWLHFTRTVISGLQHIEGKS